ncbi:MAG TPA: DUF6308 family protein [Acidimicrobiales bacterium]|nr:DUF6308 family protein [Acidimicrobiales bacterium]
MELIALPSGCRIHDADVVASSLLAEQWPYYDGIPAGDPMRIEPVDILATVSLNGFVTTPARVRALHGELAAACDAHLAAIPPDADLADSGLDAVERLLQAACQAPGVQLLVATRVLHRKRPRLIPIVDDVLSSYYFNALGRRDLVPRLQDKARMAGAAVVAIEAFQEDLNAAQPDLDRLLGELTTAGYRVTAVRLLELLLWCTVEPMGFYRTA